MGHAHRHRASGTRKRLSIGGGCSRDERCCRRTPALLHSVSRRHTVLRRPRRSQSRTLRGRAARRHGARRQSCLPRLLFLLPLSHLGRSAERLSPPRRGAALSSTWRSAGLSAHGRALFGPIWGKVLLNSHPHHASLLPPPGNLYKQAGRASQRPEKGRGEVTEGRKGGGGGKRG